MYEIHSIKKVYYAPELLQITQLSFLGISSTLRGRYPENFTAVLLKSRPSIQILFCATETMTRGLLRISKGENVDEDGVEDVTSGEANYTLEDCNNAPRDLISKCIHGIFRRFSTTRMEATPRGQEARQFLTFFVTSLFNPMLQTPASLVQMSSWTTLVPCFEEDIIYALQV